MSKKALGRGIDALFVSEEGKPAADVPGAVEAASIVAVPVERVKPNPFQPRAHFADAALGELADSIKQQGVLQPILVEETPDGFTIIAGERRYRAAVLAGLTEVPVIVRRFSEEEKLEIALIENIQREDLTPIEEAKAIKRIIEKTGRKQEEIAEKIGKNRSTVANALRLLKLPQEIQEAIDSGEISAGHARAILSLVNPADQELLFGRIRAEALSVRQAERISLEYGKGNKSPSKDREKRPEQERQKNPELSRIQESLISRLGTKVKIRGTETSGTIEIEYYSMEDLERLIEIIGSSKP